MGWKTSFFHIPFSYFLDNSSPANRRPVKPPASCERLVRRKVWSVQLFCIHHKYKTMNNNIFNKKKIQIGKYKTVAFFHNDKA